MATSTTVKLSLSDAGVFSHKPRADSAERASELLQKDMSEHHVFFNQSRFHNHIPHHLLSLFSLGASPEEIQKAYVRGHSYQRTPYSVDDNVVHAIIQKADFKEYLGKEEHYPNFLSFFQQEISKKGVEKTLQEHVFAGDDHAEEMFGRLFSGLLHPVIQLGFGIEFNQPTVIVEGLAQTAVHEGWIGPYLQAVENAAGVSGLKPGKSLLELMLEMREDKEIISSVRYDDDSQLRDGVLKRAPEKMKEYAKQFTVSPETIHEQLAELINSLVYCASASQHPPHVVKFDFVLIHAVNCSIFFSAIMDRPWISTNAKVRLLEWIGRMSLLLYASRRCPPLQFEEVNNYPITKTWEEVFAVGNSNPDDDGHLVKLIRAISNGKQITDSLEKQGAAKDFKMHGDLWLKAANMAVDSTTNTSRRWIFGNGFEEKWEDFPKRAQLC